MSHAGYPPKDRHTPPPEPTAIEGHHAGQKVPEDKERQVADDTQVGLKSRVEGDAAGNQGHEASGGAPIHSKFSDGPNSQGTTDRGPAGPGPAHATGQGRSTEGAFAEQQPDVNANPHNDFRDAAISRNEVGPNPNADHGPGSDHSPHADRTQGGDQ